MSDYLMGQRVTELERRVQEQAELIEALERQVAELLRRTVTFTPIGVGQRIPDYPYPAVRQYPVTGEVCPACNQKTPCICGSVSCPYRIQVT
jgi:hypothetical protein